MYISIEDRKLMDKTKKNLNGEILRLKKKIVNFLTFNFLLILLTFTFLNKLFFIFYTNPLVSWSFISILILLELILILATRVAIYNWKCNKSILFSYEMPDDEFFNKFKQFQ